MSQKRNFTLVPESGDFSVPWAETLYLFQKRKLEKAQPNNPENPYYLMDIELLNSALDNFIASARKALSYAEMRAIYDRLKTAYRTQNLSSFL